MLLSNSWQASFGCGVKAAIGPSDHEPKCQPPFCAYDVAVPAIRVLLRPIQLSRPYLPLSAAAHNAGSQGKFDGENY